MIIVVVLHLSILSASIIAQVESLIPAGDEVHLIQLYVIKFVSYMFVLTSVQWFSESTIVLSINKCDHQSATIGGIKQP